MRTRSLSLSLFLLTPPLLTACPDPPGGTATTETATDTAATTDTDTGETTSGPACGDDEFEPNNSVAAAASVSDGGIAAVICPGDVDTFALDISRETYLSVLGYLIRADGEIAVELLAPDESVIRRSSSQVAVPAYDPPQGVEAIHARLTSPGTYYLQVTHVAGEGEIPYDLSLRRFVNDTP